MAADKKDDGRPTALLMLAIGFALAERISGHPRGASSNFNDAEAFLKEAEARGLDPRQLG